MTAEGSGFRGFNFIRLVSLAAYFLISFLLILMLISSLLRFNSYISEEIRHAFSIFASVISLAYYQKFTLWFFSLEKTALPSMLLPKRFAIIAINVALIIFTAVLHFAVFPKLSESYYLDGEENYLKGNYPSALRDFNHAITRNPQNLKTYIYIARVYEAMENTEEAIKYYRMAIYSLDKHYSVYNDLARLYMEAPKDHHKALNLLLKVLRDIENDTTQHPDKNEVVAIVNKNLSWVYWEMGSYIESRKHIETSISIIKPIQGALERHPGTYCLYALTEIKLNEKRNSDVENLCFKNIDNLSGSEIKLYVELKNLLQN